MRSLYSLSADFIAVKVGAGGSRLSEGDGPR